MKTNGGREVGKRRSRERQRGRVEHPGKGAQWVEEKGSKATSWTSRLSALQGILELTPHT